MKFEEFRMLVAWHALNDGYQALGDQVFDDRVVEVMMERAARHFYSLPVEAQVAVRGRIIMEALAKAEWVEITEERPMNDDEVANLRQLIGKPFPAIIIRRLAHATVLGGMASDAEEYLAYIEVSSRAVRIAKLPWELGFNSFTWMFRPEMHRPRHRDFFMIAPVDATKHETA